MENNEDQTKCKVHRYCSFPGCENNRGCADKSVGFFRAPVRGSPEYKLWGMLFSSAGLNVTCDNLRLVCQLHFKPEDVKMSKRKGNFVFQLKAGALPLHIKNPDNDSATENEKTAYAAKNVTLVDINKIRKVDDTILILNTAYNETTPSGSNEPDDCINCSHLDGELQRAKMIIRKLVRRVNQLKSLVEENDCDRCELCGEIFGDNDAIEHLCEDELMPMEAIKLEACQAVLDVEVNANPMLMNQTELPGIKSEPKRPVSTHSAIELDETKELNESNTNGIASTNAKQNQQSTHKFYQCGKCDEAFETPHLLTFHMRIHSENYHQWHHPSFVRLKPESFECFICSLTRKSVGAMRKHIRQHRKYAKCEICNRRSTSLSHLCGGDSDVQCEYCTRRFKTTVEIQQHLDTAHKTNRRMYGCGNCTKFFAMIFLRDCHQASHTRTRVNKCDMCPKTFAKKAYLANHKKTHYTALENCKAVLCDECGKSFTSTTQLDRHKPLHGEPKFQCLTCPKKFFTRSNLKSHSETHIAKNFVCDLCGQWLTSMEGFKEHRRNHERTEADRRFACKQCPMKFFRSTHLNAHRKTHFDMREFSCEFCENSYKYKGDLDKHLRLHLDGKIYECPTCQMRFKYSAELQKHSFDHYNEEKAKDRNLEEQST